MLDVHPPEHGIHGVRDFFIHLLTITVGLLIALGLEAAVEAAHHRHQRIEAETTIRQELQQNRDKLRSMQGGIKAEELNMVHSLDFLEGLRNGKAGDPKGISLGFSEGPLQDAGWRTASATGVLSYVPYDEVERYAVAYREQQSFEAVEELALAQFEQLDAYVARGDDPRQMQPQDVERAIADVRRALGDLKGMQDLALGTLATYDAALKE